MPYETVDDLDEIKKRLLSPDAQEAFIKSYNFFWSKGLPEGLCFAMTWSNLKKEGFFKDPDTGIWIK